jgi:transposase
LRQWKRQAAEAGEQAFPGHGNLKADEAELRRLRRELEIVRQERDILKKAIGIFSQEVKSGPK